MPITHSKVSTIADGADTDLIRPVDWNAPHVGAVVTGTYDGDNTDNRQITTGMICSLVIVHPAAGNKELVLIHTSANRNLLHYISAAPYHANPAGCNLHATDGFVVSQTTDAMNTTGTSYVYTAITA